MFNNYLELPSSYLHIEAKKNIEQEGQQAIWGHQTEDNIHAMPCFPQSAQHEVLGRIAFVYPPTSSNVAGKKTNVEHTHIYIYMYMCLYVDI